MPHGRSRLPGLFLLTASACIYDGGYRIRGTIRGDTASGSKAPLAGVEASIVHGREGASEPIVVNTTDGTFSTEYRFGGMACLLFGRGDGNPHLRVAAPGHQTRTIPIPIEKEEPGLARRSCPVCEGIVCRDAADPSCLEIDVDLEPRRPPTDSRG